MSLHGGEIGTFKPDDLEIFELQMEYYEYYEQPELLQMAAWLLSQIVVKHYYVDGNKRTAFLVANTFLELSRCIAQGEFYQDILYNLTIQIADAKIVEINDIRATLMLVYIC